MTDLLLDADWLKKLAGKEALFVGLSGGLDSTVLLHQLSRYPLLAKKLTAIHVHHGLSGNADVWLAHCQTCCDSLSIPLIIRHVNIEQRSNIEEQARTARYKAFIGLLDENDGLVLAHHIDDQAETLLLQLFRGAGIDGMAAMPTVKPLGKGELMRPFLQHSRATLEAYANLHQLSWVDDDSNQDSSFSRNYLRHQIMPLLRERWPGVNGSLARSAMHCQQARVNLQALAELDCEDLVQTGNTLSLSALKVQSTARIANVLRSWLKNNQVKLPATDTFSRLITELIFAKQDASPCVEWDNMSVRRYQNALYLLKSEMHTPRVSQAWTSFPASLQLGTQYLQAEPREMGLIVPPGSRIEVRFRQGGEVLYYHGQTKLLKNLMQEWRVPPWERDKLPLIYIDDELAAVVGFAISERHFGSNLVYTYQLELQEHTCPNR